MRNGIFKWNQNDDREVRYEKENTFGFTLCNTDGNHRVRVYIRQGKKERSASESGQSGYADGLELYLNMK